MQAIPQPPAPSIGSFILRLKSYEEDLKDPRLMIKGQEIIDFLNANQKWLSDPATKHITAHSLTALKDKIRKIRDPDLLAAVPLLDENVQSTTLQSLPFQALITIFMKVAYVSGNKEFIKLPGISKRWLQAYKAIPAFINTHKLALLTLFRTTEQAVQFLSKAPERTEIDYVDFTKIPLKENAQFEAVLRNCGANLRHLIVNRSKISGDVLKHLTYATQLRTLHISDGWDMGEMPLERDALKNLRHVTSLTSLNICSHNELEEDASKHFQHVPFLTNLNVAFCIKMPTFNLQFLPNLRVLNISYCWGLRKNELEDLRFVTSLTTLNLASTCLSNLQGLQDVPDLRTLNLYYCRSLQRDSLKHVVQNLFHLETLSIQACIQLDRSWLEQARIKTIYWSNNP